MNKETLDYLLMFWTITRLTFEETARKAAAAAARFFGNPTLAAMVETLPMVGKVVATVYNEDKVSTAQFTLHLNGIPFLGKVGISQRNKSTVLAENAVYTIIRPEREGYTYEPLQRRLKLTDATTKVIFKEIKKPVVIPPPAPKLTARWGWTPINPKDAILTRDVFPDYITVRGQVTVENTSDSVVANMTSMPTQQYVVYEEDEVMALKKEVLDSGAEFNDCTIPDSTWEKPIVRNGRRIYYTRIATDYSKSNGATVVFK